MWSNVEQEYIPAELEPRLPGPPRCLFNALAQEIFAMILSCLGQGATLERGF